ncbi:MAG: hypothetical protein Q4C49_06730 [Bacillota bacterium]|nr:hypothetical protein [Bacillota bacterium]
MKNKSVLTITLYVFTLLSLVYLAFTLFSSYEQIVQYSSSYSLSVGTIVLTLISSCYIPLVLTVILYALAGISDYAYQILQLATVEENEAEGN